MALRLVLRAPDDRVEARLEDLGFPYEGDAAPPTEGEIDPMAETGRGLSSPGP